MLNRDSNYCKTHITVISFRKMTPNQMIDTGLGSSSAALMPSHRHANFILWDSSAVHFPDIPGVRVNMQLVQTVNSQLTPQLNHNHMNKS